MNQNDPEFLTKVSEFVTQASSDIRQLKEALRIRGEEDTKIKDAFEKSIYKAAKALYNSDFLTDETEKSAFIKKSLEDPSFLASTIEKVCNAADVSLIGKPARVAAKDKQSEYDPVMARAFGWNSTSNIVDL